MARAAPALTSIVALTLLAPASAWAQGEIGFDQQRALWTVEVGAGARVPTTLYNEFIVRRESADSVLRTRWEENADLGWETRVGVRYNPEGGVGLFLGGFVGGASTTASFSGGLEAPERIRRSVGYSGVDFGLTMRLGHWSHGRGALSYHVGGVLQRAVIDLSSGHRDALAYFRDTPQHEIDWSSRTSTSWGLNLGVTLRSPISERWSLRATFKDLILPTNTTSLAEQETADIEALSGRDVRVSLNRYTSHNLSLAVGVEYTLGWGQPRRDVIRRAPQPDAPPEVDPAVRNATRLAADGDTTAAVAALEHRVSVEPRDAFAWRELALLRAPRAEDDPTVRAEALATLERALNMNPGDTELLRAYGRLRGLTERAGRTPEARAVSAVELSSLAVATGSDGAIRVAFAARGLTAASDGQYRYESALAVFTEDGSPVPIRAGLAPLHAGDGEELLMLGAAGQLPLSLSMDFFLAEPDPGFYTVRVRLTDLETGARRDATEGFELP